MEHCTPITSCLACGSSHLTPTFDLLEQPLANNFQQHSGVKPEDQWFPLSVNRCEDCDHLQLTHAVDPALIYTHYLYVSGTSGTYLEYMKWYARFVMETYTTYTNKMGPYTVLDIGCNDGSQLDAFRDLLFRTYGVDPAENLYATSSARHTVTCGFWNKETADTLTQKFDVITTQNAFAHIPDPLTYLQLAKEKLTTDGKIFISTSQADMVLNGEFDTIYHEHISYYNAESMKRLAERAGLYLIDVVKTPIHGTSYVFVLSAKPANRERIKNILAMELAQGLHSKETYTNWAYNVQRLLIDLKIQIDDLRNDGYTIVGYGAAAKGMTLINASGIELDCVIDDNPLKQGLYCPGTDIPVVSIDWLDTVTDPNERIVFIPLAWNFYTEIKRKISAKRNSVGDCYIRYFPKIQIE
jgi:2-polyprenyl-3-methyl-5-hydroxy-6-metoxy-1,4-benzoquinol methylase